MMALTSDGITSSEVAIAHVSASTHSREDTPEGRRRHFLPLRRDPGAAVNPVFEQQTYTEASWMNDSGLVINQLNVTRKLLGFFMQHKGSIWREFGEQGSDIPAPLERVCVYIEYIYLLCLGGTRISMFRI